MGFTKAMRDSQSFSVSYEIHGTGVSTEDANQKFLRFTFLLGLQGSTASSSNLQNVAFVSENTNSTNDISTSYGVSNTSGHNSKHEQTSSYSLLASQSSCPQLDHEDLDQVDEYDLEEMTDSMNYHSVRSENQANLHAEDETYQDCFELPIWNSYSSTNSSASKSDHKRGSPREEEQVFLDDLARLQRQEKEANKEAEAPRKNLEQETENITPCEINRHGMPDSLGTFDSTLKELGAAKTSSTNIFSTVSTTAKASGTNLINTVSIPVSTASTNKGLSLSETTNSQEDDSEIPPLEDIHEDTTDGIFTHSSYDDEGAEADFTNLETVVNVSPIPTSRINPSHPSALILGDPTSAVQTRSKVNKSSEAHAFVSYVQKQRRNNHKDFHHSSNEELEELMKDQPLSADASPTALSPGYIADSNPEEDKEDPEEDPADHPADG
ncbi:hypothetical protein Tco_0103774 [Tanacetum coccineum]